jgi:hypothetical protein
MGSSVPFIIYVDSQSPSVLASAKSPDDLGIIVDHSGKLGLTDIARTPSKCILGHWLSIGEGSLG